MAGFAKNGGASYASFDTPPQQREAPRPGIQSAGASDSRLRSSLANARWISANTFGWQKVVFWTDCFYNGCPDGVFTLDIHAGCSFTVYLVDEYGNSSPIASGQAWTQYSFNFNAGCGKYRLKIVFNCSCTCTYLCFNLYQDQSNCYCVNEPLKTFNPNTCRCECASTCQSCQLPQRWN